MEYWIVEDVYSSEYLVDEWVVADNSGTFDISVYEDLAADPAVSSVTDGISPVMALRGISINNLADGQTETGVHLLGIDMEADRAFGSFETLDGKSWDGTDLGPSEAIVAEPLADAMRIDPGDQLMVFFIPPTLANATSGSQGAGPVEGAEEGSTDIHYATVTVKEVVKDSGKAGYHSGRTVFVTLGTAQAILDSPGLINNIRVSNAGGVVDGAKNSEEVKETLEEALAGIAPAVDMQADQFAVNADKEEGVEMAEESASNMGDFLLMASVFTVMAGTLLIINIFTMLAEERKKELGISRAIGMRRSSLVRTFTFEGVIYSFIAAAIGAFLGLAIGYGLISGMMMGFEGVDDIPFYYKNSSILIAFVVGSLITIGTVAYSSWKVSKLNIVRAIRSIDEPKTMARSLNDVLLGGAVLGAGLLVTFVAFSPGGSLVLQALGPNVIIVGACLLARRWIARESAYTAMGLGLLAYSIWGLFNLEAGETEGMLAIVVVGLTLVGGGVLALVSNSRPIVRGVGWLLARSPRGKAVATPAIANPLNKGFRTGMTIAMFGLIIFIVVLFSIFFAIFNPDAEGEKGGYDLVATSSVPIDDIRDINFNGTGGETPQVVYDTLDSKVRYVDGMTVYGFWGTFSVNGEEMPVYGPPYRQVMGIDEGFASHTEYALTDRSPDYATDRDAWLALAADPNLCIMDKSTASDHTSVKPGAVITLPDSAAPCGSRNYTVIGIADQFAFTGIFVQKEGLQSDFPHLGGDTLFLVTVKEGEDQEVVAKDLESDMSALGMNVQVFDDIIAEYQKAVDQIFTMFSLFMALGLVVGVVSLGVLAIRSVIERKQEIGIMRAMGYRKGMVLGVFSTEMLFVTVMGILVGLSTGYVSGYGIWSTSMADFDVDFAIPWDNIGLVIAITLVAAVVCTFIPAYKASRTNPAEAVRWIE
jgi:putative ABC transport system permease protein